MYSCLRGKEVDKADDLVEKNRMNIDLELFFRALGLAFVLEGLVWAITPEGMRGVMQKAVQLEGPALRQMGLFGMLVGLVIVWIASL